MPCRHAIDFSQTRDPLHDFDQAVTPQIGITVRARLLTQFDAVCVSHDNTRDFGRYFNYFIDSDAALVALLALLAALRIRFVDLKALFDVFVRESFCDERLTRHVDRMFAAVAETSTETLRNDQTDRRREVECGHPDIAQAGQCFGG